MRWLWQRVLAFLCAVALLLPCAGALAEFSPTYEKLRAHGLEAEVSGTLETLPALSKQSLDIVNAWLSGLTLRAAAGGDARAEALWSDDTLLSAQVKRENGYTLTSFLPSGNAYLTDPAGPDALALLSGMEAPAPDLAALPGAYFAVAPRLYEALASHTSPKTVKEPTSIKNASRAASYVNYLFKNGALNEAWEDVLSAVLPALRQALADQPGVYAWLSDSLTGLSFSGECRFKRFLDKEGNELGLQFTGQASRNGDKRKVTLFGGYTPDKGGYVSLTLAGVGSKDSLKASLGVKLTEQKDTRTLSCEGSLSETKDGKTESYALNATLKNLVKDGGEHVTGKATLTVTRQKDKTVWTFTPDLASEGEALAGTVAIQAKNGNKITLKASASLRLFPAEARESAPAVSAKDLRGMTKEQARAALTAEMTPLAGTLGEWMLALSQEERTLLLHELRTDEWMNGPTVSVDEVLLPGAYETDGDSWVVEEDEQ